MPQVADTGYLVAYWNKADAHHRWARGLSVTAPLRTCEALLTEAAYLLGTPEPLLQKCRSAKSIKHFQSNSVRPWPPVRRW